MCKTDCCLREPIKFARNLSRTMLPHQCGEASGREGSEVCSSDVRLLVELAAQRDAFKPRSSEKTDEATDNHMLTINRIKSKLNGKCLGSN